MKIYNTTPYQYNYSKVCQLEKVSNPSFQALISTNRLTHCNIGMMENGIIGSVGVLRNGKEVFLNVVKSAGPSGQETYMIKDMIGKIVGEVDMKINLSSGYGNDISHVFVEHLANHSRPNTDEFVSGLPHYQGVGTRLMQIVQRRSDESGCRGEICFYAKEAAKPFHRKLGFIPVPFESEFERRGNNKMYLPAEAKEPLSKMLGGL